MTKFERFLLITSFIALFGLSMWLQYSLIEDPPPLVEDINQHDPDYYVENFTAVGMDIDGQRRYVLEAERLAHYPDDDTALLDYPHIIQYQVGVSPRHTYAESGWMAPSGDEILLSGNVRVLQGQGDQTSGVVTTRQLRLHLNQKLK